MTYYAHSNEGDPETWQTIRAHLENTSVWAEKIGMGNGAARFATVAARLHDIGKYSPNFQKRLLGAGERVDHSTAGAQEACRLFAGSPGQKLGSTILAYCIAGHHGGLPDYGSEIDLESAPTLKGRLRRAVAPYQHYATEMDPSQLVLPDRIPIKPIAEEVGFSLAFFTRMVYSILVDADFLETESFMTGGEKPRGAYEEISALAQRFEQFLARFDPPQGRINQRRTQTLKACLEQAGDPPGLFTLTLPTGAGKTFTSMGFALKHALLHGLRRIIYVIPYTSIIEQNAGEFKKSLGEHTVLEHHSNFDWKRGQEENDGDYGKASMLAKLKLAAENWDIPIVVTTNVQFFESLFANRSSRCRKLHNIAKSVMIFDEAQMLPREFIKPSLYAVAELVRNYGSSAIFCTATQPCVEQFLPAGSEVKELIPDAQEEFTFYQRVRVVKRGELTDADLLAEIRCQPQALCIVNTRKHARGLFGELKAGEGSYHLSTLMCAAHRSQVIAEIRARLLAKQPCRVISTQLLEAGVDLDFPVGYRALAGLESIIQAAGRVNREGNLPLCDLFVFEPVSEFVRRTPPYIRQGADIARLLLNRHENPLSIEAIREYYRELYSLQAPNAFDARKILGHFVLGREARFDFKTAADAFRLIEQDSVSVIVPWDEKGRDLIHGLRKTEFPASLARALQPYTVNIFEKEYAALLDEQAFEFFGDGDSFPVLRKEGLYDRQTGLSIPESRGGRAIFTDDF